MTDRQRIAELEKRVAALIEVRDAAAHAWAAIGHAHWCSRQIGEGDCDCGHAALGAALTAAGRPDEDAA